MIALDDIYSRVFQVNSCLKGLQSMAEYSNMDESEFKGCCLSICEIAFDKLNEILDFCRKLELNQKKTA